MYKNGVRQHELTFQDATKLSVTVASAETLIAVRASSLSAVTPSGTEKRHRAVAASPTRFFELLVLPLQTLPLCTATTCLLILVMSRLQPV